MKKMKLLIIISMLITKTTHGVIQKSLAADALCKAFDETSGTLYLGLEGGGDAAISSIARFSGRGKPPISSIAKDGSLSGETMEFIALAKSYNEVAQRLSVVLNSGTDFEQKEVTLLTKNGATVTTSTDADDNTDLNDANATAAATSGIVALAANETHVFAAVRPNGGGDFGDADSGIALMTIDPITTELTIKNATTGGSENRAKLFDVTGVLKIGASDVTLTGTTNENINLHWDDKLQRLYAGVNVASGGSGARSVAVDYVDSNNILQINAIAPDGAFDNNNTDIVGTTSDSSEIHANHIRTMHTSTGPSYLIINGNVDPATNGQNSIYALPLVNTTSATEKGTLARKDSALTNGKFTVPATTNAHLPIITDDAARVGNGPLPTELTVSPSDVVVIGDTVYASLSEEQTTDNESGIFYSHALFDETGKIVRWTPWTKRAFPFAAFPDLTTTADQSKVKFFAVDAVNGKLWAISESDPDQLACQGWNFGTDEGTTATTLVGKLNSMLARGCYCALDLDQSTRGLGKKTPARYALFGGISKVFFARVSQSVAGSDPYDVNGGTGIPYVQTVTDDFSSATNFLTSQLPVSAGAVVTLEYSKRLESDANENFFFAGTQNGLYVFADSSGTGFTIDNTVNALNAVPFDGMWHKMDGLIGSILSVKTSGNDGVYVLTLETKNDKQQPLVSRLYKITPSTTVTNMQASIVLLAQSEVFAAGSDLSTVKTILGMEIITTNAAGTEEHLVIATNAGLFRSGANDLISITTATNQNLAQWGLITDGGTRAYYNIFGIDNALIKTTVWPIEIADEKGLFTFEHSIIRQLHGTAQANNFTFVPFSFNSSETDPAFQTLDGAIYFWTDGARRFFIVRKPNDPGNINKLTVFPYDTDVWGVTSPYAFLSERPLRNIPAFFWVRQIGVTGIFMAGTRKGIVALQ